MNYKTHYDRLMLRASGRKIDSYAERHHIIPKCLGGGNELTNIVRLSPEEHYLAHQLLVRMHPRHRGLIWGAVTMAKRCVNNKAYGWLKRKHAEAVSLARRGASMSLSVRIKMSETRRGRKHRPFTPEALANIRAAAAKRRGAQMSDTTKQKLSDALKGRPHTPEHTARVAESHRGFKHTEETIEKMSLAKRGKHPSIETRLKLSQKLIGNKRTLGYKHTDENKKNFSLMRTGKPHPCKGHRHTPESKAKIAAANSRRILSLTARENMAKAQRERWVRLREAKKTVGLGDEA